MSNKKTVLVTGGAGFIGSHLAEKLLVQGKKVFVLDNLSTGRKENIQHLLGDKNFKFTKGSVLNKVVVKKLVSRVDEIYHLAAAVGVKNVMEKPLESLIINTRGTEHVLEAANEKKISVLITSSSEVYGKNTDIPFKEDSNRIYGSVYNYRWGYAFSKGIDEFLGLAYRREHKLPVRVVRLFNVTGPRQTGDYGMVVPSFVRQALQGEMLTVYGDGEQTRCFAYVDDITDGLIGIMEHPRSAGRIYNLGSDEEISIEELAIKVVNLVNADLNLKKKSLITGQEYPISYKKVPYGEVYGEGFEDMRVRKPDLSKVKELIGYKPKYTLKDIIKKIIEHEKRR